MADNDDNKRRRLVEFKDGCRYGKFGKTKAYELIARERIRAYKMGGKTLIDLDRIRTARSPLPVSEAGRHWPFRRRSFSSAPVRRSAKTLVKSGISPYIDARYGSRPFEGIRRLRVHCGYTEKELGTLAGRDGEGARPWMN